MAKTQIGSKGLDGGPRFRTDDAPLNGSGRQALTISPPNFQVAEIEIVGTAPYVQNKFSQKAKEQMKAKQEAGQKAKKGAKRDPKDFKACFEQAQHRLPGGGHGIPAPAFRNALISACRLVNFKMTQAKLAVFIEADGVDAEDGTPLVRITHGEPQYFESFVRNESGVADIRARAMWAIGWRAKVRIRFDADLFSAQDVMNLLARAGLQVGVGEGRPDSKESCGMGWGLFRPLSEEEVSK